MEIKLPVMLVPEQITKVMCLNVQDTRKSYAKVAKALKKSSHLEKLIQRYFSAYQSRQTLEDILNYTGWELFRNRLLVIYLDYINKGKFPENPDSKLTESIEKFVTKFSKFCVNGYSRHYLLAFYLKGIELKTSQGHFLESFESVENILNISKFKHEKIDWLILLIWHLQQFWGNEKLLTLIKENNGDFFVISKQLNQQQFETLTENLLNYGYSINEQDIFVFEKV